MSGHLKAALIILGTYFVCHEFGRGLIVVFAIAICLITVPIVAGEVVAIFTVLFVPIGFALFFGGIGLFLQGPYGGLTLLQLILVSVGYYFGIYFLNEFYEPIRRTFSEPNSDDRGSREIPPVAPIPLKSSNSSSISHTTSAKVIISCAHCRKKLRVTANREGPLICPNCNKEFIARSYYQNNIRKFKDDFSKERILKCKNCHSNSAHRYKLLDKTCSPARPSLKCVLCAYEYSPDETERLRNLFEYN